VAFISRKTIDEIQNRADPLAIVGEHVRLESRGGSYWGLCPFHNEKTPSFSVNPERKSYYCFGCHAGGGMINFVMEIEGLSFPDALLHLAKKTGVRVEYEHSDGAVERREESVERAKDELSELYRRVAGSFHHILTETEEGRRAREYVRSRGIRDELIARFRLGYAPADRFWLHKFLIKKGYSAEFLAKSALFSRNYPQSSLFSARLIFPINDRQGRSAAFGGRILEGDGPKYLNSPESPLYRKRETLYALDFALPEIRRQKSVYLCEGYMDVIALHQAGVTNAAAPLGTAFTGEQARLVRRWADTVNLLFDTDAAGEAAAEKAILVCRENALACGVTRLELPGGAAFKDPADILRDAGEAALTESVKKVMVDTDYLIAKSKARFLTGPDDARGITRALAYLAPFYASVENETEKEAFVRKAALAWGVEPRAVRHDFTAGQERGAGARRAGAENTAQRTIMMNEELYVLSAVAVNCEARPALFEELRKNLPNEDFESKDAKELYVALEECYRAADMRLDALLSHISDGVLRDFIAAKSAGREFSGKVEEIVAGGIRGVKVKHLERRSRKLDTEIRLAKSSGRETGDLLLEKQFVIDELRGLQGVRNG
jgi:DNA primase